MPAEREIERCPWCGSDMVIRPEFVVTGLWSQHLECVNRECAVRGPRSGATRDVIIRTWNTVAREAKEEKQHD